MSYDEHKPFRVIGTTTDITAKEKLEAQKDQFLSMVSHELKTPVASIKAFRQIRMFKGDKGNSRSKDFLDRMETSIFYW